MAANSEAQESTVEIDNINGSQAQEEEDIEAQVGSHPNTSIKSRRIVIRLTPSMYQSASSQATFQGLPLAEWARKAIVDAIDPSAIPENGLELKVELVEDPKKRKWTKVGKEWVVQVEGTVEFRYVLRP